MTFEDKFMNRGTFTKMVEESVRDKRLSYMDAVVHVCESEGIDPGDSKKFIAPAIRDKIEVEAMELNLLPRSSMLPFD